MLPEVRTVIEKGNMTDAEYIAALIAENLATRSDMKKLERENRMLTEKNRHLEKEKDKLEIDEMFDDIIVYN